MLYIGDSVELDSGLGVDLEQVHHPVQACQLELYVPCTRLSVRVCLGYKLAKFRTAEFVKRNSQDRITAGQRLLCFMS